MSPYLPLERRAELSPPQYAGRPPAPMQGPGDLTYLLTETCLDYLRHLGAEPCFADYADILGALEATKLEFYRRLVAGYEDQKRAQNGDVY